MPRPVPMQCGCLTSVREVTCIVSTNLLSGRQPAINRGIVRLHRRIKTAVASFVRPF